jgi:phospholipid transport system transporter-binding protein
MADATSASASLVAAIRAGERNIDCSALQQFDSSAVAVLLEGLRALNGSQEKLKIVNAPENLARLAQLYELDSLLFTLST